MENKRPEYFRPALMVGAVSGLLSILPYIAYGNVLCCMWILGGGAVSAKLLSQKTSVILKPSDGALVGALTGIVASIIQILVSLPAMRNPEAIQRAQEMLAALGLEQTIYLPLGSKGFILLTFFFIAAIYALVGLLGGIIGVSLFAKKTVPPVTPAPPAAPSGPADAA